MRYTLPFGGKYALLSVLWGQSTIKGPNRRKAVVISSKRESKIFLLS